MTVYQRRDRVALSERVDACQIASVTEMHPGARDPTATADYSTAVNETRESTGKRRQRRQSREDEVIPLANERARYAREARGGCFV
jgi:hypothetical protein